jgi:polyisoprenoid-binding protein YceI
MTTFSIAITVGLAGVMAVAGTASTADGARTAAPPVRQTRQAADARIHLVVADEGNEARYRVREQLAGVDFPNDAVGVTQGVTGGIVIDAEGAVVSEESSFLVDLTMLKSDKERRDGYVQRRLLETEQYPTAELIPTELRGLPWPLPSSGTMSFDLVADLTVRGITRPTTWQVSVEPVEGGFLGTAVTRFTFDDFELTKPRVAVVLSVDDEIQLELQFHLVPAPGSGR